MFNQGNLFALVICVIVVAMPFNKKVKQYDVDAFLFDIPYEEKQKAKKVLSQDILKEVKGLIEKGKRVIFSGGLTVDNLVSILKYKPYAIDVASGVEFRAGKKDKHLVLKFIRRVKGNR